MQISMRAACRATLVPLALAGACLACGWGAVPAQAALPAASARVEASQAADGRAASARADAAADAFKDGTLTFAGLAMQLPEDMQVRVAGTLASATNADGTLTASVEDLSLAALPQDADLAAAAREAAGKTVAGYSTASVQEKGTVELAPGVTGYVYELDASGPYQAVKNADGTTSTSEVGPEGHWTITQTYVGLADGGFALAQVAVSQGASDDDVAAAQAAVASLALAQAADDSADADSDAGASAQADADASRVTAGGFTFELPQGLRQASDGVWAGTADNVLVEATGTLADAETAKGLTDASAQELFQRAADGMGATFQGATTLEAGRLSLRVGVFSLTQGGQSYECLLALVPVADGSVQGLTCVTDEAAAQTWAAQLRALLASVQVTPAQGAAGAQG